MVNISGGSIGYFNPANNSVINFSGGSLFQSFAGAGTINIIGGVITDELRAYGVSVINVSGGTSNFEINSYGGVVNFTGGYNTLDLNAALGGVFNLSGGSFGSSLYVDDNSTMNLTGMGLSAALVDSDHIYNGLDQTYNGKRFTEYMLSGVLADRSSVNGKMLFVQNGTGAKFTLTNVPAPASLPVFAVGLMGVGLGVLRKRRK